MTVSEAVPLHADPPTPSWAGPDPQALAALDDLGRAGSWDIGGRTLRLTNLDKVLIVRSEGRPAVTKRDLVRHYAMFAPVLGHYLEDRPVNLHRFPDGTAGESFWQHAVPRGAPGWLRTCTFRRSNGTMRRHVVLDSAPALIWAANSAAIELHPWTSTVAKPEEPSWALIDIDPGTSTTWDETLVLARLFRTALIELDLAAGAKVTGQRGIQIWIPIRSGYGFDQTSSFVEKLSRTVGSLVPELVSWQWRTDRRKGRARLDYTQNARHKTLVAPWSVRPAPGGPVSVPIPWDELDDPDLRPDRWGVHDAAQRYDRVGDPLAELVGLDQDLPRL